MAVTFDPGLFTALNRVRSRIGETDPASSVIDDDTIEHYLIKHGTTLDAGTVNVQAELAAMIETAADCASLYSKKPDQFSKSGGISVSWRERAKWLTTLIGLLRGELNGIAAAATSIGVYREDDVVASEYVREYGPGRTWFTE